MPTWDEAQAQQSAEDDWEQDAKGKPTIDRRGFGESMFQVGSRPAAAGLPSALMPPPRRRPSPRPARSWLDSLFSAAYAQELASGGTGCDTAHRRLVFIMSLQASAVRSTAHMVTTLLELPPVGQPPLA